MTRTTRSVTTAILAIVVFYGLLGVEIQCAPVGAQSRLTLSTLAADVDALAAEIDELQCANFSRYQLIGFTSATLVGQEGALAFTEACQAEFQGSRFCTSVEVIESTHLTPTLNGTAWVRPIIVGEESAAGYVVDASGVHGTAANLSCDGWFDDGGTGLTVDSNGRFSPRIPCTQSHSVACCGLIP